MVMPEIGRNLFVMLTAAKKGIVTIFDNKNLSLEAFNITVILQSASSDLSLFMLGVVQELAIEEVTNAQVWHRRRGRPHAQSLDILRKRDETSTTFEGAVLDCNVCTVGKAQQLGNHKTANHKVNGPACSSSKR